MRCAVGAEACGNRRSAVPLLSVSSAACDKRQRRENCHQGLQLYRFGRDPHFLKRTKRGIDLVEVVGHPCGGDRAVAGLRQRHILFSDYRDHGRVGHFLADRARPASFGSAALNLAALVEVILDEGPRRVVGVEIEFRPKPVQFLFPLVIQDEFLQGVIVACQYPITPENRR